MILSIFLRANKQIQEDNLTAQLDQYKARETACAHRRISRSKQTGAWLTVIPNQLNGTALTAKKFQDSPCIHFGLKPLDQPHRCDGFNDRFTVGHAVQCPKGVQIIQRHDRIALEWSELCTLAPNTRILKEPEIPIFRTREELAPAVALRGDISATNFLATGTEATFDIRVTDTDNATYRTQDPAKVLEKQEKEKKAKYSDACRKAHLHFTPLVYSVDGMEGKEAKAARKRLASKLAEKWHKEYSQVCGFLRARLPVALVRTTSQCLRGTRGPLRKHYRADPTWCAYDGLGLFR